MNENEQSEARERKEKQTTINLETSDDSEEHSTKHTLTYTEALTNFLKFIIGTGIFAMGDAFKNSGLLAGCLLTSVIGIINAHCQHILLRHSEEYSMESEDKSPPDYARTVEISFQKGPKWLRPWAPVSKNISNTFLCLSQFGTCAVYFVFVSRNFQQIANTFDYEIDIHIYMAIILIPITLECLIKNLKYIAPISMVANLLMVIGIIITLYYAVQQLPSPSERRLVANLENWPVSFGTVLFAYDTIPLVISLKKEMKHPSQFQSKLGVLNVGVSIMTVLMIAIGFLSYLKWGDNVEGSITLNLPKESDVSLALQGILAITILLSVPLQFYVPMEILWTSVKGKRNGKWYGSELVLRIGLILIIFTVAEVIPHLNIFISLVGSTCCITLTLIFPAILDLVARCGQSDELNWINIIKNSFIILFGCVCTITGTYEVLCVIVELFN